MPEPLDLTAGSTGFALPVPFPDRLPDLVFNPTGPALWGNLEAVPQGIFHIPTDLVVKFQAIDIVEVIELS